jgi:hypothetical protein
VVAIFVAIFVAFAVVAIFVASAVVVAIFVASAVVVSSSWLINQCKKKPEFFLHQFFLQINDKT